MAGPTEPELVVPVDLVGEQVLLAAVAVGWDEDGARLLDRLPPDSLVDPRHQALWTALREMRQRRMDFDLATLQRLVGDAASVAYLQGLAELRPDPPSDLEFHVGNVLWDRRVATLAQNALPALLEALRTREAPDRVRALARSVGDSLQGGSGTGRWLHDPIELVRAQMREVRARVEGHASYPYGIRGLDVDLETGKRRIVPGAAPGQVTVVTGVTGAGKSTVTAHIVLGLARQGRRVLYGAWEMQGGTTLELLACISLAMTNPEEGWSRSRLMEGAREVADGPDGETRFVPLLTPEEVVRLEERMHAIGERVRFMRNPFRRGRRAPGTKGRDWEANERNLDVVHEHITDSGCDVFVADLWKRCLRHTSPEDEEEALIRQQAMLEELGVHGILLQQQLIKGESVRKDNRPSPAGIKGSAAWSEVADTQLAPHRPAMYKRMEDDRLEVLIFKQRYAKSVLAVEFEFDADTGRISGGRSIPYEMNPTDAADVFTEPQARMPHRPRGGKQRPGF